MNLISQWVAKLRSAFAEPVAPRGAPPLPPGFLKALADGPTAQTPAPVFFPAPAYQPSQAITVPNSPAVSPAPVAQTSGEKEVTMSDTITQEVEGAAGQAAGAALKTVEAAAGTVISKIASGAVTLWSEAEALIDGDAAKVKAALPASALPNFDAVVSDVKQGASDTLTLAGGALASAAPALTTGLEKLADSALATASNGLALPLVPMVNSGIDDLVNLGIATLQAWALKAKANLASA